MFEETDERGEILYAGAKRERERERGGGVFKS